MHAVSTIEQHDGQAPSTSSDRPVWQLAAARAVPSVAVGVAVTFLQLHNAAVGLVTFSVLALGTGVAMLAMRRAVYAPVRTFPIVAGVAGVVAGVAAAAFAIAAPSPLAFKILVAAWALVSGLAEGRAWWTMRATTDAPARRIVSDWRFVAASTVLIAVVFALLPTHEVVLVGLVGAYAIVVGVFHAIAALSARAAARDASGATA